MKINKIVLSVAAGLALAASSASAFTGSLNDIVVGFTNGYTGATNLEVDVGQLRQDVAPGSYNLGNISSLLVNTYGASWASSADLAFGAAGTTGATFAANGDVKNTGYMTGAWTTTSGSLGVANSVAPAAALSNSSLGSANGKVVSLYNAMGDASATVVAANAVTIPTATAASWDKSNTSSFLFGKYDATLTTQLVAFNNGSFAAADLYKFSPAVAPEFLGTISLDTLGNLTYPVIPEPSTYAAILGIATLGFAALRRRKQALVA